MTKVFNVLNRTEFQRREFKSPEPTPIKKARLRNTAVHAVFTVQYIAVFWILIRHIRIPGSSLNPNSYPDSAFFCTLPAILNSFYTTAELFLKNGW